MVEEKKESTFKITVGIVSVEAPTKKDAISLFREATSIKKKRPIDDAVR
jgi:hypothetical protein